MRQVVGRANPDRLALDLSTAFLQLGGNQVDGAAIALHPGPPGTERGQALDGLYGAHGQVMRRVGLEPTRPCGQWLLRPSRLADSATAAGELSLRAPKCRRSAPAGYVMQGSRRRLQIISMDAGGRTERMRVAAS